MKNIKWVRLLGFVAISELAGILGSLFTMRAIPEWYAFVNKPQFSPPNWLFGPVWTVLYLLQGIAAYLVWEKGSDRLRASRAMKLFWLQLGLNALWTPIFFGLRNPLWGLVEIVFMWVAIVATIIAFKKISKTAAWLMVPYLLWVSFATILNFSIWRLNS